MAGTDHVWVWTMSLLLVQTPTQLFHPFLLVESLVQKKTSQLCSKTYLKGLDVVTLSSNKLQMDLFMYTFWAHTRQFFGELTCFSESWLVFLRPDSFLGVLWSMMSEDKYWCTKIKVSRFSEKWVWVMSYDSWLVFQGLLVFRPKKTSQVFIECGPKNGL